jgi:hypothetical protein
MKMITTNQTKQWCKSNRYFQHYLTCGDLYEPLEHLTLSDRFRRKYKRQAKNIEWEVQYEKFVDKRVMNVSDYNRNVNYCRAWKEFDYKFKELKSKYNTYVIYTDMFFLDDDLCLLEWRSRCCMKSDGSGWYIDVFTCHEGDASYIKFPFIGEDKRFEYNGILDEKHIIEATKKHIEKYLYPKGAFREYQMLHYYDKKRVKDIYRYQIQNRKWYDVDYADLEQTTIEWVKRHFNIDMSNVNFDDGIDTVNKIGKQKKMIKLERFVYSFADHLDGDLGELEMAYWEEVETYPTNSYFVN